MDQREQLFLNYSRMRDLLRLIELLPNQDLYCEVSHSLSSAMSKMTARGIKVTVAGEFNRGKSLLVNVISGHEITPVSALPMTKSNIHVRCGREECYRLDFGEGALAVDRSVFDEVLLSREKKIYGAYAEFPDFAPGTQIELIDTCGLNDHEEESLEAVFNSDLLVWVLVPDSPISQTESDVLKSWMNQPHGKLLMVLNKIDQVDAEENTERLMSIVHERLEKTLQVDMRDTPLFPISARSAYLASKKCESMQESGVPGLWNRILMTASDAALYHRLKESEEKLKAGKKELNTMIDSQRQAINNAILAIDGAQSQLDDILNSMTLSIGKAYQESFSFETCVYPDFNLEEMKDQLKSAVSEVPEGVRNAKKSAIKVGTVGRKACAEVQDQTNDVTTAARESFIQTTNLLMAHAMNEMEKIFVPVNEALRCIHRSMDPIHVDFVTALASFQLIIDTDMPKFNCKFEDFQLAAMMLLGKDTITNRLSSIVDRAFIAWRKEWKAALETGNQILTKWHNSMISEAMKAFEVAVDPVKTQILADYDVLSGVDLDSVLTS